MSSPAREEIVTTVCHSHCGGTCPLRLHAVDGRVTRIETTDDCRACARGRAYRQRLYAPGRLLQPMKRVGERGTGQFRPMSWDEALGTVARELVRIRERYGPEAILYLASQGDVAWLDNASLIEKVLIKNGGYSGSWGSPSGESGVFSVVTSYGTSAKGNSRDDFLNSRVILLWGWNPAVNCFFGQTPLYLARAREKGTRIVALDPRCTDSVVALADEWVPIRPGTDAAVLIAMAYVVVKEGLQDQGYIDRLVDGYEQYRQYVLGTEDGVPKTPQWAEAISGVAAARIAGLAREVARSKPVAIVDGFAPGRSAYGEQYHRAAIALAAITGNIGISGGSPPGGQVAMGDTLALLSLGPFVGLRVRGENPVDAASPPRPDAIVARHLGRSTYMGGPGVCRVHRAEIADAILGGRSAGYPADYRLLYVVNHNYLNQTMDTNRIARALERLDFIVVHEQFMTPTARYADIILATSMFPERNDVSSAGMGPFYGYMNKAAEPAGETRSQYEIAVGLSRRLGLNGFAEKSDQDWLREVVAGCKDIPDYDAFRRDGIQRVKLDRPYVCFERQVADPEHNPFPTRSGKIDLYSPDMASLNSPEFPPVPKYIESWESRNDPLAGKYPLQLVTTHPRRRAHTQFDNLAWLRDVFPQVVTINTADAEDRGIKDGDLVLVLNDRGKMAIPARVTERIMPGVVEIPQGAWFDPDENGIDRGGCTNVLTAAARSPAGGFPYNTCLVEVQKATGMRGAGAIEGAQGERRPLPEHSLPVRSGRGVR